MVVGLGPLLAIVTAPAGAQEYPPGTCSLSLSVSVATRGQTVLASTVNCTSPFEALVTVQLELFSAPIFLASTESNSSGQFSNVPFVVPEEAELGLHAVRASGPGADVPTLVLEAPLTVVADGGGGSQGISGGTSGGGGGTQAATTSGRSGGLAFTGSDSLPLLWLALILLTIGTALVLAARRRSQVRRRGAAA